MNDYIFNISDRLSAVEASIKKLNDKMLAVPSIEIELTAYSAENLAESLELILMKFQNTQLKITAKVS